MDMFVSCCRRQREELERVEKAREELRREREEKAEGTGDETELDKSHDSGKRERKKKKFDDFVVSRLLEMKI